jgi:hypothetical protein
VRRLAQAQPTPFIDGRKSVASRARAKHRLPDTQGCQGPVNCPRRGTIALGYSRRLCAAAGTVPPPLLDGRKSGQSTAHANMHTSIGVTGYPRSGKLPAAPHHRSRLLSQTVRGHGDAALTRRIAPSRSARLGSSPIQKSDYRQRSSTHRVGLRGCLCAYVCVFAIAVGCPSFTLCQGTKHGRKFREIDGRTSLTPSLASCRARCFFGMVCRLFRAMQLRKVSGARNKVPERIPWSVSASRT